MRKPKAPFPHRGGDSGQARFNDEVTDALNVLAHGLNDYDEVEAALTTSVTRVPHKLKRPYRGWWIVDRDADARVWRATPVATEPQDTSKYIYLQASAAVNVLILLY